MEFSFFIQTCCCHGQTDQVFTHMLSANLQQEQNFHSFGVNYPLQRPVGFFLSLVEKTSHFSIKHILPHFANYEICVTHGGKKKQKQITGLKETGWVFNQ